METETSPTPAPQNNRQKQLLIGGGVAVLLLCCCCVLAAGALIYFDPLGWNLWGRFFGGADPLAAAVPADDIFMYTTVDVGQLGSANVQKILDAFADVPGAEDVTTAGDAIESLDKTMQDELGLTFTDDILPWAGQYVGVVISNLQPGSMDASSGDMVFLIEARDSKKAEAFVTKFTEAVSAKSGTSFETSDYKGVTLYTETSGDQPSVMALSKNLLLLSNSAPAIEQVIDTQQGNADALAKTDAFKALLKQLPKARLFTLFIPGEAIQNLASQGGASLGVDVTGSQSGLNALQGVGMSVATVDVGVQVDAFMVYDEKTLSDSQRALLQAGGASDAPGRLPSGTLAYWALQRPDLIWATYRDTLNETSPGDFDDAMTSFEDQFGFNPDTDFMSYLNGELVLALLPDTQGFLAESGQGDVGFVLAAQVSDEGAIQSALAALNDAAEAQGTSVGQETLAGVDAYSLDAGLGSPIGYYGVGQKWLTIASSASVFTDVYDKGEALSGDTAHKEVWKAFPSGVKPVLYVNVAGALDLAAQTEMGSDADAEEIMAYLRPIRAVVFGSAPFKSGALHSTLIVFIEKP